jgi:superoxide dismutase, Cu-Zn family
MVHRIPAFFLLAVSAACGTPDNDTLNDDSLDAPAMASLSAAEMSSNMNVEMRDLNGRSLGTLQVTEADSGVMITGQLSGLAAGEHGFHIHQVGNCVPPFTSAGDHFNPTSMEHGHLSASGGHQGDLRNITVGSDSTVTVNVRTAGGVLRGEGGGLLGSLVVHANADDYRTDPDGNSGARIACGVLGGEG